MDIPENLQVIKSLAFNTTPEKGSTHNIKERLKNHVHVKRRLQQEHHIHLADNTMNSKIGDNAENNKRKEKQKTQQKTRRARKNKDDNKAHSKILLTGDKERGKRTARSVPELLNYMNTGGAGGSGVGAVGALVTDENGAAVPYFVGGNAEDGDGSQGSQEAEMRSPSCREKDSKDKDILGMVLSLRKRALLQDPQVQEFLGNIMNIIKS